MTMPSASTGSDVSGASRVDRLWVPLLSHYRNGPSGARLDADRMAAHLAALKPTVRQFLLAGSTGDGWEFSFDHFTDMVQASRRPELFGGTNLLFGVLRRETSEVVEWARILERWIEQDGPPAGRFVGLTICPPVDPSASLANTRSPIAVYQLPQVTGCSIEPSTMRTLAADPRIMMFKDTSGTDTIANDGPILGVLMVRGAEGGYIEALRPDGPYDGWLLSTGNVFGTAFRRLLELAEAGHRDRAIKLSDIVARMVEALFDVARELPFGNPFSNANRAVDHLRAYGAGWRQADPPLTISGETLPPSLLEAAADLVGYLPIGFDPPYLVR
jgi:4-hydroxy-tetrahydrodipicolinate synthase